MVKLLEIKDISKYFGDNLHKLSKSTQLHPLINNMNAFLLETIQTKSKNKGKFRVSNKKHKSNKRRKKY
tara:strand:- start:292 stop:498 length:207 start_codon:yes stop_codon:yes gene_type:complete